MEDNTLKQEELQEEEKEEQAASEDRAEETAAGEDAAPQESTPDASEKDPENEDPGEADPETGADNSREEIVDGEWQEVTEEGTPKDPEEKKGFFRRKKDKRDQQIEELTDRVRRQMAEFDNFRKRTEKEKSAMYEIGAKSVIEKLLPVVDSFERGLDTAKDRGDDPFVTGMQMIYKQMMTMLEGMDVKPIEAVGQPFDPEYHNAVMHVEDENVGENIVVEEFQKGYLYRDSVVRHSMVKVAN